jgi:predicted ATP-grasp superfamily ATP-dependent carboligase
VIVKPRHTFDADFPGKNAIIEDRDALIDFFREYNIANKAVVQRIIPSGDGDILVVNSYSGADGKVQAAYSIRKIRQFKPDYGATSFGVSEHHPKLIEKTIRFLNAIGYRGFAMSEFARSRYDARIYFLELNTRTCLHNQLGADIGVDLTQIGYLDMVGQGDTQCLLNKRQKDGVYWLDFRRDRGSMKAKRRNRELSLIRWLAEISKARSFALWDFRDPQPFFAAFLWSVRRFAQKHIASRISSA